MSAARLGSAMFTAVMSRMTINCATSRTARRALSEREVEVWPDGVCACLVWNMVLSLTRTMMSVLINQTMVSESRVNACTFRRGGTCPALACHRLSAGWAGQVPPLRAPPARPSNPPERAPATITAGKRGELNPLAIVLEPGADHARPTQPHIAAEPGRRPARH